MMTVFLTNSLLLRRKVQWKAISHMRITLTRFLTRQVQRRQSQKWKKTINRKTSWQFLNEEVGSNEHRWQYGPRRAESSCIPKRMVKHRSLCLETGVSVWFWVLPRLTQTEGRAASGQKRQRACSQTVHQEKHREVPPLFLLKLQVLLQALPKPPPGSKDNPPGQVPARHGLLQREGSQWHYLQRWHTPGQPVQRLPHPGRHLGVPQALLPQRRVPSLTHKNLLVLWLIFKSVSKLHLTWGIKIHVQKHWVKIDSDWRKTKVFLRVRAKRLKKDK